MTTIAIECTRCGHSRQGVPIHPPDRDADFRSHIRQAERRPCPRCSDINSVVTERDLFRRILREEYTETIADQKERAQ